MYLPNDFIVEITFLLSNTIHVYKIFPSCQAIHAKKGDLAEEDYGYNVNEEKIIHALAILRLLLLLLL